MHEGRAQYGRRRAECAANAGLPTNTKPGLPTKPAPQCYGWQEQVQVVDLSGGGAKLRGKIALPMDPNGGEDGWGWSGCYYYDWFNGADVVQVNGSTLAFRRWDPQYVTNGGSVTWVDASSDLFVVDLSNPDAPSVASTVITDDPTGWWGNMRVVGSTLYTSHYEWTYADDANKGAKGTKPVDGGAQGVTTPPAQPTARYYLDRIDLGDLKHPDRLEDQRARRARRRLGFEPVDPLHDRLRVGHRRRRGTSSTWSRSPAASLTSRARRTLDGYVGNVIVRGTTAYMTSQVYSDTVKSGQPQMVLHQIDLSNPKARSIAWRAARADGAGSSTSRGTARW